MQTLAGPRSAELAEFQDKSEDLEYLDVSGGMHLSSDA